jgi:hypothetical protein
MKREARLANLRERNTALGTALVTHEYDFRARIALEREDLHFLPTA